MKLTLYVKGVKKLAGEEKGSSAGYFVTPMTPSGYGGQASGPSVYPDFKVYKEAEYKSVLPEDQKDTLEMLEEMSRIHRFDLKIVDVTRGNFLRRLWVQETKRIHTYPTLISESGERLQGRITPEQVKALITHEQPRNKRFLA